MSCLFESKLKEAIVSCMDDIKIDMIDENTDLVRDFNFDSINIVELVVAIENNFDIEIDDENLLIEKLSPYKELVEMLKVKLGENTYDS